jgi:hypothetical protein
MRQVDRSQYRSARWRRQASATAVPALRRSRGTRWPSRGASSEHPDCVVRRVRRRRDPGLARGRRSLDRLGLPCRWIELSPVLRAIGVAPEVGAGAIRFSRPRHEPRRDRQCSDAPAFGSLHSPVEAPRHRARTTGGRRDVVSRSLRSAPRLERRVRSMGPGRAWRLRGRRRRVPHGRCCERSDA